MADTSWTLFCVFPFNECWSTIFFWRSSSKIPYLNMTITSAWRRPSTRCSYVAHDQFSGQLGHGNLNNAEKKKNKKIKNDLISRRKKKREIQSKWTTSWQSGIPSVAGPFGVHQRGETRLRDAANHWRHPKFDYGLSNVTESSTERSRPPAEGRRSESEVPPRSGSEE